MITFEAGIRHFLNYLHTYMSIIHQTCPLCGSGNIEKLLAAKDHLLTSEAFEIFTCRSCAFLFTQAAPAQDEIGRYYRSQDYISHSDTRKGLMNRLYHLGRSIMLYEKYRMVRQASAGIRLLDIGTGTGYFPGYMKKKGYQVTGMEVDPDARSFAQKEFSFQVFAPEDFTGRKIEGRYDVITLWHVLEHVHDFHLYMERMKDYLEPGGTLIIALPNCNSFDARHYNEFWAGYDVPRHLWHFTPSAFTLLAAKHDLEVAGIKSLPLDPFYNSMLSEKYKGNNLYMVSGAVIGKLAWLESRFNIEKSSSVVYFIRQKTK